MAVVVATCCLLGVETVAQTYACTEIVAPDDVSGQCRIITDPDACPAGAQCWSCDGFYSPCNMVIDNMGTGSTGSHGDGNGSGGGSSGGRSGDGSGNSGDESEDTSAAEVEDDPNIVTQSWCNSQPDREWRDGACYALTRDQIDCRDAEGTWTNDVCELTGPPPVDPCPDSYVALAREMCEGTTGRFTPPYNDSCLWYCDYPGDPRHNCLCSVSAPRPAHLIETSPMQFGSCALIPDALPRVDSCSWQ